MNTYLECLTHLWPQKGHFNCNLEFTNVQKTVTKQYDIDFGAYAHGKGAIAPRRGPVQALRPCKII